MKYINLAKGLDERMKNISVFMPILGLLDKTKYPYDMLSLGIMVMLFILENMLEHKKDCTFEKVAYCVRDLIELRYKEKLAPELSLEITQTLIREYLMNKGTPFDMQYFDYETGLEKTYKFHLIEYDLTEVKEKRVNLKLSPEGLEFLFKTREMYSELQITIAQLYLRQQIKRGVFDGALRTVDELLLSVQNVKKKIQQYEDQIKRNVLDASKQGAYETHLDNVNQQLEREKEIFVELQELIEYTLDQHYSGRLSTKEDDAIQKITQIQRKLREIIYEHDSLFRDKLRLQKTMTDALQSLILNAFDTRINFDTDILQQVIKNGVGLENLRMILDPMFSYRKNGRFNPQRIFLEQSVRIQSAEKPSDEWEDEETLRKAEEKAKEIQKERDGRLEMYLKLLLTPLLDLAEVRVHDILRALEESDLEQHELLVQDVDFYSMLVQLHQAGEILLSIDELEEVLMLDDLPRALYKTLKSNPDLLKINGLVLVATEDVIRLPNNYVMSDFKVQRRETRQ